MADFCTHWFRLSAGAAARLVAKGCQSVIFPYLNGDELLGAEYLTAPRFSIDFDERDIFAARAFPDAFDVLRTRVLADWAANAAKEKAQTGKESGEHQNRFKTWWQLKRKRGALLAAIAPRPRYVACSRVTKRRIFEFLSAAIRPDFSLTVFPFADDYSFGSLQSSLHFDWFKARCSTLESRFRYTSDTFPWPQTPTKGQIAEVAAAAVALRALRREIMARLGYSLRALYRTLDTRRQPPPRSPHPPRHRRPRRLRDESCSCSRGQ